MEDVYTIKVKTKPDTKNLYPSERRYSASTVSGLAWVHIALAATSFLLACLALVSPNSDDQTQQNSTVITPNETTNFTANDRGNNNFMLVLAPTLITIFGLAAGLASILASTRWYVDKNITWLFVMSTLSSLVSLISFVMIAAWFVTTSEGDISDFYKDKIPFKEFMVVKNTDVVIKNESHMVIALNNNLVEENPHSFTKRVLSINILIAAFLELLWSILSVKISYKGMRNSYKDESNERRGTCVSVVTKIKGNDTKEILRNGKLIPPKLDLIEHYPSRKMKRLFLAQDENGFYLRNQDSKIKQNTETSSEYYKERMMNFLNRCAAEGYSEKCPSVQSEPALNAIPEGIIHEIRHGTPVSWGDTPDHTVYNQNTINFDKIFRFKNDEANEENLTD